MSSALGSRRVALLLDAIRGALDEIEKLPVSTEAEALRGKATSYESEVLGWTDAPPTDERREAMMKVVLGLHVAVTRLRVSTAGR